MTFQDFTGTAEARQRYWARAHLGWRVIGSARPNAGHRAVAAFQAARAAARDHHAERRPAAPGRGCGRRARAARLARVGSSASAARGRVLAARSTTSGWRAANPGFAPRRRRPLPDGDVDLDDVVRFQRRRLHRPAAGCSSRTSCSSARTCRRPRRAGVRPDRQLHLAAGAGFVVDGPVRVPVRAAGVTARVPIAIINQGPTRADDLATVRVDAPLGETLTELLRRAG